MLGSLLYELPPRQAVKLQMGEIGFWQGGDRATDEEMAWSE